MLANIKNIQPFLYITEIYILIVKNFFPATLTHVLERARKSWRSSGDVTFGSPIV